MSFAVTVKDAQDLRRLIPLNILSASRFEELCARTGIEEAPRGSVLFNQGDAKNEFVYVLSGTVSLQAGGMEMETITGGTESARFALAHQIPRKVSAIAKDRVRYIRVDATYVNQPTEATSGAVATYEVSDIPDDSVDDWVATLLKSPIFQRLPPANLQNILSSLEEVPVRAGQEIIHQDEPGDYYYVIKRGRCVLTRKPSRLAREIKLAVLKTCDTFGEDSLISEEPRNVTVTMKTDGALLRLSKADFLKLVKEPVVSFVNMDIAQKMIPQGARWLDVRAPDSFEEGHLPGALNVPFFKLRMELANLSRQLKYILVCETGKVSEAAAFLLIRHEFDAYVLKGGVSGVFKDQLVSEGDQSSAGVEVAEVIASEYPQPSEAGQDGRPESRRAAVPSGVPIDVDRNGLYGLRDNAVPDMQVLEKELMELKGCLEELQRQSESAAGVEGELTVWLGEAGPKIEDAVKRLQAAANELALLKDSCRQLAPVAHAVDDLRSQLAKADEMNRELEERIRADQREADARREASEAGLRAALKEMEAGRESLQQAVASSRAENDVLRAQLGHLQESVTGVNVSEEPQTSAAVVLALEQARDRVSVRNQELERQVTELTSLVQTGNEELGSVRAELEKVKAQAANDVIAMQRRQRESEQESARLRAELESARQRMAFGETAPYPEQVPASERRRKSRRGMVWVMSVIGMLILGAVVVMVLAVSTDAGRGWIRDLVVRSDQG